jgi:CelD/BcsL family acetyltransferase involved in cellulose biosynthesis
MMQAVLQQEDFDELLSEWAELFEADDCATPFQSAAWARAWSRHWSGKAEPWVLVVRDGRRLTGLLPLWSEHLLGLRVLRAAGDPADYCDLLARPNARNAVEGAVARELRRRHKEWDVLVLSELPPDSTTAGAVERAGLRTAHQSVISCPGLQLPDTFDAYVSTLPSRRRTNLRRHLRYLDDGELQLRVPAVEDLPAAIDRWQALRVRQWHAMGKRLTRAHATASFRNLLLDVVTELVPAGLALVWEFVRDGEVLGSFVNFCDDQTFYQYLGAFEPEAGSFGIGKMATAEGIRSSIAAGRTYYDFTRGDEPYKYWFGAVDRLSPTVVFRGGRARSGLAGGYGAIRGDLELLARRVRSSKPASRALQKPPREAGIAA